MSKLYENYLILKKSDNNYFYLFKSGMFYIFIDNDAQFIANELHLKLTNLNDSILKCGFPINSLNKYCSILDEKNVKYKIIENNSVVESKKQYIDFQNIQIQLDSIKKLDINKLTPLKAFELISNLHSSLRRTIMKRFGNLYENIYNIENIMQAFNEVCRNTKNKNRVNKYKEFKCIYISRIYNILKNNEYSVGPYNVFTIYEPKKRRIVSQQMQDKIINHLVGRYILNPALLPCLIDSNVASREKMGTAKGLSLFYSFQRKCKIQYRNILYFKMRYIKVFCKY